MAFFNEETRTLTIDGTVYDVSGFSPEFIDSVISSGSIQSFLAETGLSPINPPAAQISLAGPASNRFLQEYFQRFNNPNQSAELPVPTISTPPQQEGQQEGNVPDSPPVRRNRFAGQDTMAQAEAKAEAEGKARARALSREGSGVQTEIGEK